jgi:hypothetical protein
LGKNFNNSWKIGPNFFLPHIKNKIIFIFVKFVATKNGLTKKIFHPCLLLLFLDPGSGMGKNQDPGSGINIPDPQHCRNLFETTLEFRRVFIPGLELVDLRISRVVCQARLPRMDKSSSILMLHNHQSFIQVKFMPNGLLTLSNNQCSRSG